jgi:hypothetical protein
MAVEREEGKNPICKIGFYASCPPEFDEMAYKTVLV